MMRRLTERLLNGVVRRTGHNGDSIMLRLAAYEDTGLTPEEVGKLREKYEEPGQKCNRGHVNNLPLRLWTCPVCAEELAVELEQANAQAAAMREALEHIQATAHCQKEFDMQMEQLMRGFAFNRTEWDKKKCRCHKCTADEALASGVPLSDRDLYKRAFEEVCRQFNYGDGKDYEDMRDAFLRIVGKPEDEEARGDERTADTV